LHCGGVTCGEGLAAYRLDLLLQFRHRRSGHWAISSLFGNKTVTRFHQLK